jgi:hypothetical protein
MKLFNSKLILRVTTSAVSAHHYDNNICSIANTDIQLASCQPEFSSLSAL